MRNLRLIAIAGFAALALASCTTLQSLTSSSPAEVTTVYAAEQAYTAAAKLEAAYLNSGAATKAQATFIKNVDNAVYADVVAGRTAAANNDSAAIAVALKLFNQARPELLKLIPGATAASSGGANVTS